ncbi:MAG: hypothetical protein WC365_09280 [Candidatus Babeliales bacterium]|jgi:hypothetical protein
MQTKHGLKKHAHKRGETIMYQTISIILSIINIIFVSTLAYENYKLNKELNEKIQKLTKK